MVRARNELDRLVERSADRQVHRPVEVRIALLNTMRETPVLVAAGLFWSQVCYCLIFLSLHSVWLAVPAGLDMAVAAIRLIFGRNARVKEPSAHFVYHVNILASTIWIALIAGQVFLLLHIPGVEAVAMSAILTGGFMGYVTVRFAAFPGVAMLMIGLLNVGFTLGLLTSPFDELMRLGFISPAGGIAFGILMMHAHDIMMEAIWAKHENRQRSLHDPLTGLPNRLMMAERLAQMCQGRPSIDAGPKSFALLCLDLDGFKQVNDRYGHAAGDEVLITVTTILLGEVGDDGLVCRIGGDEFVVLLQSADRRRVAEVAERLVAALSRPFSLARGISAQVGVTIGASLYPQNGTGQDTLLSCADDAMYEAKRAGKGRWMLAPPAPRPLATAAA